MGYPSVVISDEKQVLRLRARPKGQALDSDWLIEKGD